MRKTSPSHPPKILSLSLVFLLTGLFGCSHGSQGEQQAAGAKPGAAAQPAGAAAPSSSAPAASAAAPAGAGAGSPAAGGPAASGAPGGAAAGAAPGQAAPAAVPLAPEKIPAVVAKVNGAPIKKDELIKTADQIHRQMAPNAPATADFYRKVLDNLVNRELLLQEAKAAGVTASDEEVTKQLAELKARFPSPEKFQEQLKAEGMTEAELTQRARDAFVVQKLLEKTVVSEPKVTVTEQEEKAFYDKNQEQMKRQERVHVRHILVKADKGASAVEKQKAKEKAESLLAKVKAGGDFEKLATENSDDPGSKQHGGDLSWVLKGQTVPQFEAAAFALKKPNELSPVVETDYGYHVIQLIEHQDAGGVMPFAEVKDRIGEYLKQKQSQEKQQENMQKVQEHLKTLKAKSKVEVFI